MTTFKVVCMHRFPNSLPCFIPLHSNMFLLIRQAQQSATAHQRALHSNMFLLIRRSNMYQETNHPSLHSNMFLLIPARISPVITTGSIFTFQYVSINTGISVVVSVGWGFTFQYVSINTKNNSAKGGKLLTLHSNMFLLIPKTDLHHQIS